MQDISVSKPWENPECVGLNRLPARATFYPFQSEKTALLYDRDKSTRVLSLNGEWDFHLVPHPEGGPDNFVESKFKPGRGWKKITVPGNWTTQGFDKPHYTNVQMPFSYEPPTVPEDNPTGLYRTTVEIPKSWRDRVGDLEDDYKTGALNITARLGISAQPEANWTFVAQLYDATGKAVFKDPLTSEVTVSNEGHTWPRLEAHLSETMRLPKLWSSESPTLYTLVVSLASAYHTSDLDPREEVFVNLDVHQRGLGGASCGPDTLEKYRIQPGVFTFCYRLRPYFAAEDPGILARQKITL